MGLPGGSKMRQAVLTAAALTLYACGGREALDPALIPDIEGAWSFSGVIQFSELATCNSNGNMNLTQEGQTFFGVYTRNETCSGEGGSSATGNSSGNVSKGQLSLETIQFDMASCEYRGVFVTKDPIDRLSGTILCTSINLDGSVSSSSGTWEADRLSQAE